MSLLTIIQDVVDEFQGIARPSSVLGNTDTGVKGLLANANREGRELAKAAPWTVLQRVHSFTTVASQAEYSLPSDFARISPDSEWDESTRFPLRGPVSMQGWRLLKVSLLGGGVVGKRYRVARSESSATRVIFIDPTPSTTGETLSFYYISDGWATDSSGTTLRTSWAADSDELLLDEDLYKLGVIIRYKRSKGLDFASEAAEYSDMLDREKAQDRPAKTIEIANRRRSFLIDRANIPETIPTS